MTDPRDDRRAEFPLEPWALEIEGRPADSEACQELSRVVGLLRNLPEPEASDDLVARILERVAEQRARPRVLRGRFGDAAWSPRVGLALAAGIAGFAVLAGVPGVPFPSSWIGGGVERAAAPTAIPVPVAIATVAEPSAPRVAVVPRRSAAVVRPQFVSVYAPSHAARPRVVFERTAIDDGLDQQLNQLMLDPTAFALRLQQMPQRDGFIARLAERAAQRGDAPEIALRVRRSPHPLAGQIVNRMLHATLVARSAR